MNKSATVFGIFVALAMLATPTMAQETTDQVILAGQDNYPDALLGGSVSEKLGMPVLLTERDRLSQEAVDAIEEYSPEEVVIIGGPAVVSEEVEEGLGEEYNVTRLWGMTRYGTAEEVVDRYWPEGAESAVLVEDSIGEAEGEVLANAKSFAGDRPVLPVPEGRIPAGLLEKLDSLEVRDVDIIGTSISNEMRADLSSIGVNRDEEIQADSREQVEERLRERTQEEVGQGENLLIVAHQSKEDIVSTPSMPKRKNLYVGSEEEIQGIVDTVEDKDVTDVKIVGYPPLAQQVAEELEGMDVEVDLVVERAATAIAQTASVASENRPEFAGKFENRSEQWRNRIQANMGKISNSSDRALERARGLAEDYDDPEMNDMIDRAEQALENGEPQKARELSRKVESRAREMNYEEVRNSPENLSSYVEKDQESLRQRVQELTQINQEFGQMMQENMTVEERLDTVKNFRQRRMSKVEEIAGQAVANGGLGNISGFREQPERPGGRQPTDNQTTGMN